jgi:hypothetical protein
MVRPNDEWVARVSHLRPGFSGRRNERAFGLYPRTNRTGAHVRTSVARISYYAEPATTSYAAFS